MHEYKVSAREDFGPSQMSKRLQSILYPVVLVKPSRALVAKRYEDDEWNGRDEWRCNLLAPTIKHDEISCGAEKDTAGHEDLPEDD